MAWTTSGEFFEPGYCLDCGLPTDADGDCPNPLCFGKDAIPLEFEQLEGDEFDALT
jgi:hypothetical protein